MIKITFDFVTSFEILCELFAIFARDAVNDTTLAFKTSFKHDTYVFLHIFDILFITDFVNQVWPIETALKVDHFILDVELFGYIILYFYCCSCCET